MRRIVVLVLIALMAASCGPSDDTFPFDAVLIDVLGTDDVEAYLDQIDRDARAGIVDCMAASGFEFVTEAQRPPKPTKAELASPEFVESDGFGIISRFRQWLAIADFEQQGRDLNQEYLHTLTGAEVQRFLLTLDGDGRAEPGQLPDDTGCRGSATEAAFASWTRFFKALPNFTAMGEERDTHPDWLVARADWHSCMIDKGYDYSEPDAIATDVLVRMNDTVTSEYPDGLFPLTLEDGKWIPGPEVAALLQDLQDFELAAAAANQTCNEPLLERFNAVEREVQEDFVDRNRDTIDELLAGSA